MASTIMPVASQAVTESAPVEESVFDMGVRLAGLLAEAGEDAIGGRVHECGVGAGRRGA